MRRIVVCAVSESSSLTHVYCCCCRHDDPEAFNAEGEGRLAPNSLECEFEDTPINPANSKEAAHVRSVIRQEIALLKAQQQ